MRLAPVPRLRSNTLGEFLILAGRSGESGPRAVLVSASLLTGRQSYQTSLCQD